MIITAFLTCNGTPRTGLTPTIKVYETATNTLVVNGDSLTEIGDGFYKYDFVAYDPTKDYVSVIDAGSNIHPHERYHINEIKHSLLEENILSHNNPNTVGAALNEIGPIADMIETLLDYAENKTKIDPVNHTLTIYADDGVTPIKVFNLRDEYGNPSVTCIFERIPQ